MSLKISRINSFGRWMGDSIKWPNSAACFADGRLVVADSGNDRVVIFDKNGHYIWSGGGRGFGISNLREPIGVFVTPNQWLIVSDWHNHRLVAYTPDLQPSHQIGHLGKLKPVRTPFDFLTRCRSFLGNISIGQFAIDRYFTHGKEQHPQNWFSIKMLLKGLLFYVCHPLLLYKILFSTEHAMLKPNGAVFPKGHMLITQKGFQCLSYYKIDHDTWSNQSLREHVHCFGKKNTDSFDRLANITMSNNGDFYVCDQQNFRVAVFSPNLEFIRQYDYSRDRPDGPFSCVIIDEIYLAAVAGFTLEIRRLDNGEVIYEDDSFDETHGITWDPIHRFLYVVDRSGHAVHQLKIEIT